MKKSILTLITLLICLQGMAQLPKESSEHKQKRMEWWVHDRFGMFIHWGLYALPARHEWVKTREKTTNEEYQKYFNEFNPDLYNPKEWARMAKEAGMKYAVITTKHHEGFCLFDSKYTEYKAPNTPAGRDLLKEWVDAFRAEGLKIGFYYSLIDWHHPDFTVDDNHPLRGANDKEFDKVNKGRNMDVYRQYLKDQIRELLTNYGDISMLWLDFSYPGKHGKGKDDWDSKNLLKMVRELQPNIIVNDRLDLKDEDGGWDFTTPEQFKVSKCPEYKGKKVAWETCQTFSGSWGYHRDEQTWKDNKQLLVLLVESVAKGGNLLLNVGPTARGYIDNRAQDRLKSMGEWMHFNSRSIYGCTEAPAEFKCPEHSLLTYNPKTKRLYIHLLDYPLQYLTLQGYDGKVKYIQFLHDGSEIQFSKSRGPWGQETLETGDLNLTLPVIKPNMEIPVIEVILK